MGYYTQRHGMRKSIEKTYDISIESYALLFDYCRQYDNNIAWKYPEQCGDGQGCCGLDVQRFELDLKYEIPSLFRDEHGRIVMPVIHRNVFDPGEKTDEYDQYALFDLIEFYAQNSRDVIVGSFHSYYGHHHLACKDTNEVFLQFQKGINDIFTKTGLLYRLNDDEEVERIFEYTPLTGETETAIATVAESGTRQLLNEAISIHKSPFPNAPRDAAEKIWDALERLKTYYPALDKKASASKIVNDMAGGQADFATLFDTEFVILTKIGNDFRIRHHETNKIDITDVRHYDYFFNRCLSLIALAIQYLK